MQNKGPDILILALARWDSPYSSTAFSLAKELSSHRRVFLIDNPYTVKDFLQKGNTPALQRRQKAWFRRKNTCVVLPDFPNLYTCTPPLMLPINWLPQGRLYDFFSRINQGRMRRFIQRFLQKEQIETFDLLNIFNPFYSFQNLQGLNPRRKVYYSVDRISESEYISKHGPSLEKKISKEADFCLATSSALRSDLASFTDKQVFLLPNAADVALFQQALQIDFPIPSEFRSHKAPIILYVGAIGLRIDFDLLDLVSRRHSDKHFVFIGPKGSGYDDRLEKRPNVSFLEPITQEKLPSYFQHASCAIIPFQINSLTAAIYPLKIHEYLAAGLPVVSTPFSADIKAFGDQISLSSSANNFGELIEKAIKEPLSSLDKSSISSVELHSWKSRAKQLFEHLK